MMRRRIVGKRMAALMAALMVAIFAAGCGAKPEEEAAPVVTVRVARAVESDQEITVRAPATVFPREQANIASRITAPILQLGARKGDRVSKGQMLARLDNRDLIAQRQEIAASVKDAEASLEKMRSGTVPTDIEKAKGQVATTQAALSQAEKIYERRKQLFEQGAIPNRDLLVSQTEMATARANYDVAQRTLSLLERQSSGRDIQIAESRLEQARGRLSVIDTQISFSELKSPFSGIVTEQFVYPGDMAQPSTPMFTVADLDVAIARAQVPETDASGVHAGQVCRLTPSDRESAHFDGRISVVNQAVDAARRTVEVWCEIPNGKGELRAQVFGSLEIAVGTLSHVVTVPPAALQLDEGTRSGFVMLAGADKKAHKQAVETGAPLERKVPVLKGVRAGELVIVEGAYGLADGTAIKTAEGGKK
ncbi:MAG: efflux RND transporter periplasmic adaptor subunit [Acidobacteriota bacterium]